MLKRLLNKRSIMDLIKRLEIIELFDNYGALLSEKQQQIFDMYINKNLSYAEVANMLNISRQAVKYALDNAVNSLNKYENTLHFVEKLQKIKHKLEKIRLEPTTKEISNILEEL